MTDIENEGGRRSASKKSSSHTRSKSKSSKGGLIDDALSKADILKLPTNFKQYGIPTDIGSRIVTFSDIDRSVYDGIMELPYLPMPFNFILPSKF